MAIRDVGYPPFIQFMRSLLQNQSKLVIVTNEDLLRATDIIEQYADSRIDFVDCAIAAMSERLNVVRIFTLDQRHFRLFRPRHVSAFDLRP